MQNKILIVNTGSDSHKYALYEGGVEVVRIHMEREGAGFVASMSVADSKEKINISVEEYSLPSACVLKLLVERDIIVDNNDISAIGLRVVAPEEHFMTHNVIDDEYIAKLVEVQSFAPLHIGPIVEEIEQIKKALPGVRIIGVSDSAFHRGLPDVAREYAISRTDSVGFGIHRYGFHGISYASIVYKIKNWSGPEPARMNEVIRSGGKVVVCHLGSGCSIAALKNGKSIDTSMGFTPLEGLPMGSRIGNIDPGAVLVLGQKKGLEFAGLEKYFNTECGLLGLSGKTKDVRGLIELEKSGDAGAKLALDSFAYNVKKYIGAYFAALGGLDLLVFTATIGERSNIMRERFCAGLEGLGLVLDKNKNDATISMDGFIHDEAVSPTKIAVIATDEMGEMARLISRVLSTESFTRDRC